MLEDPNAREAVHETSSTKLFSLLLLLGYFSLWILRIAFHTLPGQRSTLVSICFALWKNRAYIRASLRDITVVGEWYALVASLFLGILISYGFYAFNASQLIGPPRLRLDAKNSHKVDDNLLDYHLFPCQTTHSRFFPKKHSFKYSYLLVGVPLPAEAGELSDTSAQPIDESVEVKNKRPQVWFHVKSQNHLGRDGTRLSLRAKLNAYLIDQVGLGSDLDSLGRLTVEPGRRSVEIPLCLSGDSPDISRPLFQSCLVLVSV